MPEPPLEQDEAFALIVDTSSSAAPYLDESRRVAKLIYDLTGVVDEEQFKLFTLDRAEPIPLMALKQTSPPGVSRHSQTCSLIAPVMEALVREGRKRSVIIVGSGEIFDLEDWVDDPRLDGWLLVRTGARPLQGPAGRVSEITEEQISGDVDTLLSYFSRGAREAAAPPRRGREPGVDELRVDPTGYPLVYVEPLRAHVQLFPVTKPQFEKFIASGRQPEMNDEWYAELLTMNPRASYRSPDVRERERLFMTGVTTDEMLDFARWLGRDYTPLTAQEWCTCYEWLAGRPAPPAPTGSAAGLAPDALCLWDIVEGQWLEQYPPPSLRELSLMTQGVLEWVIERPDRFCGLGEPAAAKFQRRATDPVRPTGKAPRRLGNLGFRLRTR